MLINEIDTRAVKQSVCVYQRAYARLLCRCTCLPLFLCVCGGAGTHGKGGEVRMQLHGAEHSRVPLRIESLAKYNIVLWPHTAVSDSQRRTHVGQIITRDGVCVGGTLGD
jgi:hypothetical protein